MEMSPEPESAFTAEEIAAALRALHADSVRYITESALGRRQLPHPLLGPLTVREMLLFTLYHNRHHVEVVRTRAVMRPA